MENKNGAKNKSILCQSKGNVCLNIPATCLLFLGYSLLLNNIIQHCSIIICLLIEGWLIR